MQARWLRWVSFLWALVMVISAVLSMRTLQHYFALSHLATETLTITEQYHTELVHCEQVLLALLASEEASGRLAGYEPTTLHQNLRQHIQRARQLQERIATLLNDGWNDAHLTWLATQAKGQWVQLEAEIESYLARSGSPPPLQVVRFFRGEVQSSPYQTLLALRRVLMNHFQHRFSTLRGQLLLYGALFALSIVGGWAWVWLWWVRPARRFRRWVSEANLPVPPALPEWEQVHFALHHLQSRLLQAERFMRDLAMGRTPEPIPPEQENDALARSSRWLLQRFERLRESEKHQRHAV